jgi:hypothetical protein
LWTSQSFAGIDFTSGALAAATNDNLVGDPTGRTRMADWSAAAHGVAGGNKHHPAAAPGSRIGRAAPASLRPTVQTSP